MFDYDFLNYFLKNKTQNYFEALFYHETFFLLKGDN